MNLPHDFKPKPALGGQPQDWHAGILLEIAARLGVGSDAYYPLLGAAAKIEDYARGRTYAEAVTHHGGAAVE